MVVGLVTFQRTVLKFGSEVEEMLPCDNELLIICSCAATIEFCVVGRLGFVCCASWKTFTVWLFPSVPVYVKLPFCAACVNASLNTVDVAGCLVRAKLPKKKSLSCKIGPPTLPPKLFLMNLFLRTPAALLVQLLAFKPAF